MSDYLFVYGTLIPGCEPPGMASICRRMQRIGEATLRGRLYDLGHYPGAVIDPADRGHDAVVQGEGVQGELVQGEVIWGEVVAVEDEPTWRELDRYEGCPPHGGGLFRRVRASATLRDGSTVGCWVYVYNQDVAGARPIDGGCWRTRQR